MINSNPYYLFCFKTDSGLPIFTRTNGTEIPESVVSLMNVVHMFCLSNHVELHSVTSGDYKVLWKVFAKSITLILVFKYEYLSNEFSEEYYFDELTNLVDLSFKCMLFCLGGFKLMSNSTYDELKNDVDKCFPILDFILCSNSNEQWIPIITQTLDIIVPNISDLDALKVQLSNFNSSIQSLFSLIFVNGKLLACSLPESVISSTDLTILQLVIRNQLSSHLNDYWEMDIYFPDMSPTLSHKMVVINLIAGIDICSIFQTGNFKISQLLIKTEEYWLKYIEILNRISRLRQQSIPLSVKKIDKNVISFVLIDHKRNQSVSWLNVHPETETSNESIYVLYSFYKDIMSSLFVSSLTDNKLQQNCNSHLALETYICTQNYKCYALSDTTYYLFILYSDLIPNFALSSISRNLLKTLQEEKCTPDAVLKRKIPIFYAK